jgi:peroxiredoxin
MKNLPDWIPIVLRFAGVANAVWGLTFSLFTEVMLRWAGLPEPFLLFPWKIIGLLAVIFGAAYYLAAAHPVRHVLIICVGLFIKLSGLIMLISFYSSDLITARLAFFFALKDALWSIVFIIILYFIFKAWQAPDDEHNSDVPLSESLQKFSTQEGTSLYDLSFRKPVFLVFLRPFGCTFCREVMADLQQYRQAIEAEGMQIVFAHMGSSVEAELFFEKYGFTQVPYISDPTCRLYNTFQLKRGSFYQLFGIHSWIRRVKAGIVKTHGIGQLVGEGFRMAGVFVIYKGEMLKSYRHAYASDRPDYVALANCELA